MRLLILVSLICVAIGADTGPVVTTKCGSIEGKVLTTPKGQCDAYLGVPFAAPPVGDLRFQKPQDPECWNGTYNATAFGSICVPIMSNGTTHEGIFPISEDCLYLNIFVPKLSTKSSNLPVMVFIHGGAFIFGSAQEYGQEGPCENLALRGVILITLQYRLGLYGFFSTGDEVAAGNYGLWDQVQALKWVHENIAKFGGDPNQVTIFGESAGGASVSYLTYAPVAKDYFQRSISESGSARSFWASFTDSSVPTAKELAKKANCTGTDSKTILKCLREFSTVELQEIMNTGFANQSWYTTWGIRVDGELYNQSQLQELKSGKPAMIGTNTIEAPYPEEKDVPNATMLFDKTLNMTFTGNNTVKNEILRQTARFVYLDSKGDRNDKHFVYQQLVRFQGDITFFAGAAKEATEKEAAGDPVWLYKFNFFSDNVFPANFTFEKGALHAHELCYLFLMYIPPEGKQFLTCPEKYDGKYRQIADVMGEMWTNFAIKGNPSPKTLTWPNFNSLSNASALIIQENLKIEPDYYVDRANFWNTLMPEIESDFGESAMHDTKPKRNGGQKSGVNLILITFIMILAMVSKQWTQGF